MYDQVDEYDPCTNEHHRDFGHICTSYRTELSKWSVKMLEERRDKLRALHGQKIPNGPYPYNHPEIGWTRLFFTEPAQLVYKWEKKEGKLSLDVCYGPMAKKPKHKGVYEISLNVEHFNPKTGKMHDRTRPRRKMFVRMEVLYDILDNEEYYWSVYEADIRKQIEECQKQVRAQEAQDKNEEMAKASAPAAKEKGPQPRRKSRRLANASKNIDGPKEKEAAEAAAKGPKFSCQKTLFSEDAVGPTAPKKVTLYSDNLWHDEEKQLRSKLKFWVRTETKFESKSWLYDQEHNPDYLADVVINNLPLADARLMAKELFDLIKEKALKGFFIRRFKGPAQSRAKLKRQHTMKQLQTVEDEIAQVQKAREEIAAAKKRAGPKQDDKTNPPPKKRKSSKGPTRKSNKAKKPTRKGPPKRKSPRKKTKGPTRKTPRKKASGPKPQATVDLVSEDDDFEAEAAPSSAAASLVTPVANEEDFEHKPHYVRSAKASSGYKGVIGCNRAGKPWRVKYKGDTVARVATKAEACEHYYQMVRANGPSSSRTKPDVIQMITQYDVDGEEFTL